MHRALTPLKYARLWTACGYGFVGLVIYLSLTPDPPDMDLTGGQDFGHVIAYFWLMLWFAQLHRDTGKRLAYAAAFLALGIGLEYVQGWTGYRDFDYWDMLRDFAGIAIGFVLALTPLQHVLRGLERWIPAPEGSQ
jgi:VanZ family protein